MSNLLFYTPDGTFGIYTKEACPPGVPETFKDQAAAGARLKKFTRTPALRFTLYLNYVRYVAHVPVNTPDAQLIKGLADKLADGALVLQQLSGAPAPGKDAKQQPKPFAPPPPARENKEPEVKRASAYLAEQKPKPEEKYKIVIEVAGTQLTACCHDRICSAPVGPRHERLDFKRTTPMTNAGRDKHRHEVTLGTLTSDPRAVYLNPGCNEADDAVCLIPLHTRARPVGKKAENSRWPTALVPVVPLVFTDADNTPEQAMALGKGWLYIYLDGHLWRELYAYGDGTFRDVNFSLSEVPGLDARAPSGHAVTTILVPHTVEGDPKRVEIAFAEAQWTWRQVCAMGGPADDDPRFLPKVLAKARNVPVDQDRRAKRFHTLDLSAYPGPFKSADGRIVPIEDAPRPKEGEKDPFARLRDKKIAAVILENPLLVARGLAGGHQQAWRAMQDLLDTLARAPETSIKEKTYEPGRWFEAAVLANQFLFAPFPDFESWQKLHPEADQKAWQKTKDHRDRMQATQDKEAIDEALGVKQREALRPGIDATRKSLVDYLSARTKNEMDLLVLMLDDYFVLPQTAGEENTKGKNPYGYADGWGVIEQLIARLGDHSFTLDADLFADPPDTARLTRENPGAAFLNTIADPDRNHVLYTRLFPKPAGDILTPDTSPADDHAPAFKPQRFADKDQPGTEPVADFARHWSRAAMAPDHPRIRQSITRLVNAVFDWQLTEEQISYEEMEQHGITHAADPDEKQALFVSLLQGAPTGAQLAAFLRRMTLFLKEGAEEAADEAVQAAVPKTAGVDLYSIQKLNPKKHKVLTADNLHDYDFKMAPGDSIRVKKPPSKAEFGFVSAGDMNTTLKVVNRKGKIIGGQSMEDFRRGIFDPRKWSKWLKKHRNAHWFKTRVTLTISKTPDTLARLGRMFAEKKVMSRVIIPLAVMFETWNVSNATAKLLAKSDGVEASVAKIELLGALIDFSSLSAAITVHAVEEITGKPIEILALEAFRYKALGYARGALGIGAGAYSASLSGRDMLASLRRNDDAAVAHGVMFSGFALSTLYDTAWAMAFLYKVFKFAALAWAVDIASGPLMWISLGLVLAGAALLVFITREDTPLQQWLANGPFSIRTFTPNLVPVYDETAVGGDLVVDENNCLVGFVPCARNKLVQRDGAVFQVDASGKPLKKIGGIGRPVQAPGPLKDPTGRFAHHKPGDMDLGPPPGGSSTLKKYTGTAKVMEFWKEPDGSHLWITKDGILHDCYIKEEPVEHSCIAPPEPVENHRLSRKSGTIYLTTAQGIYPLGRIGSPIQNRDKLLVDRRDDPADENNRFRNWCEKPASAYSALAAALFTPRVQTVFSAVARPGVKYPDADPFKGYDYLADIHISLPYYIQGRSRLLVQLWQTGVERVPKLIYDKRIAISVDDNAPMQQMSITWPLEEGYNRKLDVTTRVKLDLYGDGRLWLPLDPDSGKQLWMTETSKVDKLEIRYEQDPLAVLMEVGM